jgi:hypothetical protein
MSTQQKQQWVRRAKALTNPEHLHNMVRACPDKGLKQELYSIFISKEKV